MRDCTSLYSEQVKELYTKKNWWLGLTIGDLLDKMADVYPYKEALVGEGKRYTYAALRAQVDRLAYNLHALGLRKGERVMLQLPNWPEFIIAYFAIQKAGLVMVLLTTNHTAREIVHLADLTQPAAWILPAKHFNKEYAELITRVREQTPSLKNVIIAGDDPIPEGCRALNDLMKEDVGKEQIDAVLEESRPDPDDVCFLLPTGGTTNLPKCAIRTHNDYICNVEYVSRAWDICSTDNSLVATTVGHNLALLVSVSGPLFHGGKIVLIDSTRPADFCRTVQEERVTCASLVPTLLSRIVAYDELHQFDFSSLDRVYVGAANSPPELVTRAEKLLNCRYINAFGMAEGPCSQTRPHDPLNIRGGTIGLPVCPYDDFRILDPAGEPNSPGVEGELAAKGPGVFSGYFRNNHANQSSYTPDGYFRTGDLATRDGNGRIRITGRLKDIIIRGGENISARDVEDLISSHPKVEYVAAVGVPNPDLGEQVGVFIKTVNGCRVTGDEIIAHMQAFEAPKTHLPVLIEFVETIPLTAAGKANKKMLRKRAHAATGPDGTLGGLT